MSKWCIHTRRLSDGQIITTQVNGPPDGGTMFEIATHAIATNAPGEFEIVMVHEVVDEEPDGFLVLIPYFPTAIENMIFQGMLVVKALSNISHFIINKQKESDS